jgi:ankyrin repeat protein
LEQKGWTYSFFLLSQKQMSLARWIEAVRTRDLEACARLDDNLDARDETTGDTPLHLAVTSKFTELVKMLVDKRCVQVPNNRGATPLVLAALSGDIETCELLLQNGTGETSENGEAVRVAVQLKRLDMCEFLISRGVAQGLSKQAASDLLSRAAWHGSTALCQLILDAFPGCAYAPPEDDDDISASPLCIASRMGYVDVCKFLIDHGAMGSSDAERISAGLPALCAAAQAGCLHVCELLIERGVPTTIPWRGSLPREYACARGHANLAGSLWPTTGFEKNTNSEFV